MQDIDKIRTALQDRVIKVVSDETGINRVTIGLIKSGKKTSVSKSTFNLLAQYLGVSTDA